MQLMTRWNRKPSSQLQQCELRHQLWNVMGRCSCGDEQLIEEVSTVWPTYADSDRVVTDSDECLLLLLHRATYGCVSVRAHPPVPSLGD